LSNQNNTYIFIPRDFLQGFAGVNNTVQLPSLPTEPIYIDPRDTIPSNIDTSTISYVGEFLSTPPTFFMSDPHATVGFPDSGIAVSLQTLQDWCPSDQVWLAVDAVLIRVDTYHADRGRFPVYSNRSDPFLPVVTGYDAAVCVQRYEPWIVETYNTSIASPSISRIVGKGNAGTPLSPSGSIQGAPIANTRYLNTTRKEVMIHLIHSATINQMQKDIGKGNDYEPFPTVGPVVPS